ncbi:MAG: hypothetical protein ACK4K9_09775 [Bacteroidia bacterium]
MNRRIFGYEIQDNQMMTITLNDSIFLMNYGKNLSLGLIDLVSDSRFRKLINDSILIESFDDKISFTNLKRFYNDENNNLETKLVNSANNHGGSNYYTDIIIDYTDSFQIGNYYFRPILNIPFSNEVNLTLTPLIGVNWIKFSDELYLTDYISNINYAINEETSDSVLKNKPCWFITFRYKELGTDDWNEYMPFRRCTCPRVKRPDGTVPSRGKCNGYYNGLAPVCERANICGKCSGNSCDARIMDDVILPPFN